jgi:hypothetical protein
VWRPSRGRRSATGSSRGSVSAARVDFTPEALDEITTAFERYLERNLRAAAALLALAVILREPRAYDRAAPWLPRPFSTSTGSWTSPWAAFKASRRASNWRRCSFWAATTLSSTSAAGSPTSLIILG